ncbi:MAG: PAS domain S-box protein [Candidatus Thermoplasmatota archaeon]
MRLRALLIVMCLAIAMIPIGIISGFLGFEIASAYFILIVGITFCVSYAIAYFITRPLEKLTKTINEISRGNLDVTLEKSEILEINALTESLNRVLASLKLAIHKVGVKKGEIFEETVKAKEAAEKKYQDLLNTIDAWAWETDARGIYTFCSPKVADALGYKPEEVVGKSIFEFMPPDEAKKVKIGYYAVNKKQTPMQQLEQYYFHKNGTPVRVFTNAVPIFDHLGNFCGYRGVHRDVTTHEPFEHKIEELILKNIKVKEWRKRAPHLFKEYTDIDTNQLDFHDIKKQQRSTELSDYSYIFDDHGNIIDCTGKITEKLGYEKEDFLNLSLSDFDTFEDPQEFKDRLNTVRQHGETHVKTIHKRKDGSLILVSETIEYLKDKGLFRCIVKEDFLI